MSAKLQAADLLDRLAQMTDHGVIATNVAGNAAELREWAAELRAGTRFEGFDVAELSELAISLDHRLTEAQDGNAYVWVDIVHRLWTEVSLTENIGAAAPELAAGAAERIVLASRLQQQLPPEEFCLLHGSGLEISSAVHYGNGTVQITLKPVTIDVSGLGVPV